MGDLWISLGGPVDIPHRGFQGRPYAGKTQTQVLILSKSRPRPGGKLVSANINQGSHPSQFSLGEAQQPRRTCPWKNPKPEYGFGACDR